MALKKIVDLLSLNHDIIPIEACLATKYFFYNEYAKEFIKPLMPSLVEKVLHFTKDDFCEPLNTLLYLIIDIFPEEVTAYSPQFAELLCQSILKYIEELILGIDEGKGYRMNANFTNHIYRIKYLLMISSSKIHIVKQIFISFHKVVHEIFNSFLFNFDKIVLDLLSLFAFFLQDVDENMVAIFDRLLSRDEDDFYTFNIKLSRFVDNYFRAGKASIIDTDILDKILAPLDVYLYPDMYEDYIYADHLESGCLILDSLMLNAGQAVDSIDDDFIFHFVKRMAAIPKYLDYYGSTQLFVLETIMICFIVSPENELEGLDPLSSKIFTEIFEMSHLFKRSHDKKIFILFLGQLFKLPIDNDSDFDIDIDIDYFQLNNAFVEVFCSLPEAIKERNKRKMMEDTTNICLNITRENWEHPDIIKFDAYDNVRLLLSSYESKSIGELSISCMTPDQLEKINNILEIIQENENY